jgi:hypothetical protein
MVWLICVLCRGALSSLNRGLISVSFVALCFLSSQSVFWVPSLAFAIAFAPLDSINLRKPGQLLSFRKILLFCVVLLVFAGSVAANYFLFARPNHTAVVAQDWDKSYHAYLTGASSVTRLVKTVASLMVPRISATGTLLPLSIVSIFLAGAVRSVRRAWHGDTRGLPLLLAGCLPILAALAASALHQYPVLDYPRLLVWMLPCFGLLLCFAIEPVLDWLLAATELRGNPVLAGTLAACLFATAAATAAVKLFERETEPNREIFRRLQAASSHGDCLFIHGTVATQFQLYRNWLHWNPRCVYIGHSNWPCCAVNVENQSTDSRPENLQQDVATAVMRLHPHVFWLAIEGGAPRTWSMMPPEVINQLPQILANCGCVVRGRQQWGNMMLMQADCAPKGASMEPGTITKAVSALSRMN